MIYELRMKRAIDRMLLMTNLQLTRACNTYSVPAWETMKSMDISLEVDIKFENQEATEITYCSRNSQIEAPRDWRGLSSRSTDGRKNGVTREISKSHVVGRQVGIV